MNQRESRYVTVAKIAYRLSKQALPKYSHAKSPHHYELPQLAACVLFMFYLNKSYRDMEEWLLATDKVCQALGLSRIPDHTTLQRTYRKLRKL
ncbi:MAG: transposase, partial [Anaerolineales bacterium]|nr:transposase [Anaerolineales bacterium]